MLEDPVCTVSKQCTVTYKTKVSLDKNNFEHLQISFGNSVSDIMDEGGSWRLGESG